LTTTPEGLNGQRLIYERREVGPDGAQRPPRLWWLDLTTEETVPVFEDSQWLGFGARFSPDGQWLAYVAPHVQAIAAYNLSDGRNLQIPSQLGEPPVWSPKGTFLLVTDMVAREDGTFAAHVFRVNVESGQSLDLSGNAMLSDSSPAWSFDGNSIAVTRVGMEGPGGQVWTMSDTGADQRPLTDDPYISHAALSWSPDGRSLLEQHTFLQQIATSEIWIRDMETGAVRRLAESGVWPSWAP
jgi:Tol biopolymer transport system component